MDGAQSEAVPRYLVEQSSDGKRETVQLLVWLPGVEDSSQIFFLIEGPRHLVVHCPGRFRADIPLSTDVESEAEAVRFLKKKGVLKATLLVAGQRGAAANSGSRQQEDGEGQGEEVRQQQDSAQTPPPKEQPASRYDDAQAPVQAARQQQQQPRIDPAPAGPSATSPREQLDAQMYAAATQHSNRDAAAEFFAKAQQALHGGEAQRAHRLLQKACKLDPGSSQYQAALQAVADSGAGGASGSSQQPQSSGGDGSASGSSQQTQDSSGAGAHAGARQASRPQPEQREEADGHRMYHQERRRQQRQTRQEEAAAAAEAAAEALAAAVQEKKAREKARKARMATIRYGLIGLACLCVTACSLYWLLRLAPPAAPLTDAEGGWKWAGARLAAALLFVPRVLLWHPTWSVALLWAAAAGCGCGVVSAADYAQQQRGTPAVVPAGVFALGLMAAWHPLLWCACGGGWGAVLGTLAELLPLQRAFGSSTLAHLALYPAACRLLRWAASWPLPAALLRAVLGAPLLWLWRRLLWQPRWWLSLPAAAALLLAAELGAKVPAAQKRVPTVLWLLAAMCAATWWLLGGGWWAVVHLATVAAAFAALLAAMVQPWPQLEAHLTTHFRAIPAPFLVAKLLFGLVWAGTDVWSWVAGLGAAVLLYLHLAATRDSRGDGGGRGGGRGGPGQPAGAPPSGMQHLYNDVPAGAPEAVAAILKAGNYYEVLGVGGDADEASIRRAKRTLSLATHPDKIGDAPGANDAFNLVTEASDVLGDPDARRQYDAEMADASLSSGFNLSPEDLAASGIPPEFAHRMQEFVEATQNGDIPQHCDQCGGYHFLRRTDRPMAAARQCDDCGMRHAVRQNEVWFEGASAGFLRRTIHMYCCYKGVVYDMSEGAECEGTLRAVHERAFPLNRHVNFFRGFGLSTGGGGGGGGKKGRGGGQQGAAPRGQGPRGGGQKKKGRRR